MTLPAQSYVICSNPRSGTTLLCDMLSQTGAAGRPNSFFRDKSLADWCSDWNVPGPVDRNDPKFTRAYFDAMWTEGCGGTGVFGLRLMGPDLRLACDWLDHAYPGLPDDAARFEAAFGKTRFIHLSRHDKLAEAVSYIRAEQTGLWHGRPDGSTLEYLAPTLKDAYDAAAITQRLNELTNYDKVWHRWFARQEIAPFCLSYEALAESPVGCLQDVLRFIGQDPSLASDITPGVRKLADEISADWIHRYRLSHPNT